MMNFIKCCQVISTLQQTDLDNSIVQLSPVGFVHPQEIFYAESVTTW